MTPVLARCTRGLEWVLAAELSERLGAAVTSVGHREVRADVASLDARALELGSADDVFVVAGEATGIGRARAFLPTVTSSLYKLADPAAAVTCVSGVRAVPAQPSFDVVGSFLGKRNYNRFELEDAAGAGIVRSTGWRFESRSYGNVPDTDLSFRVHVVDDRLVIALRVGERPLHRRAYRKATRAGSLHPPLAFAVALLAGAGRGGVALDPCGGSGTIAIEGALHEPAACWAAFDVESRATLAARENARSAGVSVALATADAARLPLDDRSVRWLAANPPWGRTVAGRAALRDGSRSFLAEVARILEPRGRVVLFVADAARYIAAAHAAGLRPGDGFRVRVSGAWADMLVLGPADDPQCTLATGRWKDALERALATYAPERPAL